MEFELSPFEYIRPPNPPNSSSANYKLLCHHRQLIINASSLAFYRQTPIVNTLSSTHAHTQIKMRSYIFVILSLAVAVNSLEIRAVDPCSIKVGSSCESGKPTCCNNGKTGFAECKKGKIVFNECDKNSGCGSIGEKVQCIESPPISPP